MKIIHSKAAKRPENAPGIGYSARGLPRAADVVLAVGGLLLTSPLLLASALMVATTSPGGVLFRQKRVGLHGRIFTLYKLRTMRTSANGPQVTSGHDPRITTSGRFLRKTKLDELPTFWNVIKGDMAMVGPRPEVPRYVKVEDPVWQRVLSVRPGLTDPVTLDLRNEEELLARVGGDPEEYYLAELQLIKMKGYEDYLQSRNWQTDLKVLWRTLVALLIPQKHTEHISDKPLPRFRG